MKVSKATLIRTICLVVALINQILTSTGHTVLPFSDDDINEIVTLIFTAAVSVWTWWKNNSFTANAIRADDFLKQLKSD
jgi:SPP1 family holin